jgi:hypothetical protein
MFIDKKQSCRYFLWKLLVFNNVRRKKDFMIVMYQCQKSKEQVKVCNQRTFWNIIFKTEALGKGSMLLQRMNGL